MNNLKNPIAIFVMGRPGSGKDTQADILAEYFNLMRVSTSDLLREKFENNSDDEEVAKQKEIFETGELNDPAWVVSVIQEYLEKLSANNFDGKNGIIFSGSPRTLYEAENVMPTVEGIFGAENIFIFYLKVSKKEGIKRIKLRDSRPLDRGDDKIKFRMEQFKERTWPAVKHLKKNYNFFYLNGESAIKEIAKEEIKNVHTSA